MTTSRGSRGLTLSGQLLWLQAVTVLLVVLVVTPVLAISEDSAFRRSESRRAVNIAESVASTQVLRVGLAQQADSSVAGEAERIRSVSGAALVTVYDARGGLVYSSDPDSGDLARGPVAGGPDRPSGVAVVDAPRRMVVATVPVLATGSDGTDVGQLVGYVQVGRAYPRPWERLGAAAPAFLAYVLVGSVVGLVGSLLISRRIKRQTLGLEPLEIRGLVEHQEALLHGLREGVVAVDASGRLTVVNDEARRLLRLPEDAVGRMPTMLEPALRDVLVGRRPADELPLTTGGRMLVLNQLPVHHGGRHLGWVTTVRDRTEQLELSREVEAWRDTTDVLRAQAHEFSNRLHTVAGLVELEEYDELRRFVAAQARARSAWVDTVLHRVHDRSLAALLIAKGSQARERGADLGLAPGTAVPALPGEVVDDLLTVVGNLVDNAIDALSGRGRVVLGAVVDDVTVTVTVTDDGPGLDPDVADRIFEPGVSTKHGVAGEPRHGRGWGLALCRLTCEQRGGTIAVETSPAGTRFVATVPLAVVETGNDARD
jgi:sensor histidine kinase regulating citrate/malate metabolism